MLAETHGSGLVDAVMLEKSQNLKSCAILGKIIGRRLTDNTEGGAFLYLFSRFRFVFGAFCWLSTEALWAEATC